MSLNGDRSRTAFSAQKVIYAPEIKTQKLVATDLTAKGDMSILGTLEADSLKINNLLNRQFENEIHVGNTDMPGPDNFVRIQAAIDRVVATEEDSVIIVHPGIYIEDLLIPTGINISIAQGSTEGQGVTILGRASCYVRENFSRGFLVNGLTFVGQVVLTDNSPEPVNRQEAFFTNCTIIPVDNTAVACIVRGERWRIRLIGCILLNGVSYGNPMIGSVGLALEDGASTNSIDTRILLFETGLRNRGSPVGAVDQSVLQSCSINANSNTFNEIFDLPLSTFDANKFSLRIFDGIFRLFMLNCFVDTTNSTASLGTFVSSGIKVNPDVTAIVRISIMGGYFRIFPNTGTNLAVDMPVSPVISVLSGREYDGSSVTRNTPGAFVACLRELGENRCQRGQFVGADISANLDVGLSIDAGTGITAGTRITAGTFIEAGTRIEAGGNILAGLDVVAGRGLVAAPLSAQPPGGQLMVGGIYSADGVGWDPAGKAGVVPYPVYWDGVAFTALY